jgi:sulfate permease, SulP family
VFLPLQIAIVIGALLSVGVYLLESSRLQVSCFEESSGGQMVERSLDDITARPQPVAVINLEGSLFFGAMEELEQRLEALLCCDVQVVILRLRSAHLLASTGAQALERIVGQARRRGKRLIFCGVQSDTYEVLRTCGLVEIIGDENIFRAGTTVFESTNSALQYARSLLASQEHCDD